MNNMKDKICEQIVQAKNKFRFKYRDMNEEPDISIYIDHEHFNLLMHNSTDEVNEIFDRGTLMGYPVHRVVPLIARIGKQKHRPFRIVCHNL